MILNYFGSKARIIEHIDKVISPLINKNTVFGDLFAGTGCVSNFYKNRARRVVSNDMELYSYVLNKALTQCVFTARLQKVISNINDVIQNKPIKGLVWKHFSPNSNVHNRMYFTCDNAMRIDATRIIISKMFCSGDIGYKEFMFLLASLLFSVSRVANTAGTFRAYLKHFSSRASKSFILLPIHKQHVIYGHHNVIKNCALKTACKLAFDVVYLDPPYNANHYGGYYSFYNYLCLYNPRVKLTGVSGVMKHYNKSIFGFSLTCKSSFSKLIKNLNTKHIIMSYNSNGVLSKSDIVNILLTRGSVTLYKFMNRNYKPNKSIRDNYVTEFLFVCDCHLEKRRHVKEVWLKI